MKILQSADQNAFSEKFMCQSDEIIGQLSLSKGIPQCFADICTFHKKSPIFVILYTDDKVCLFIVCDKVFCNKSYGAIISTYHFVKNFTPHSNYNVAVVKWPTFVNSSISMREVTLTPNFIRFDKKNRFFWGVVLLHV